VEAAKKNRDLLWPRLSGMTNIAKRQNIQKGARSPRGECGSASNIEAITGSIAKDKNALRQRRFHASRTVETSDNTKNRPASITIGLFVPGKKYSTPRLRA
jgi:hypothetical protein